MTGLNTAWENGAHIVHLSEYDRVNRFCLSSQKTNRYIQ